MRIRQLVLVVIAGILSLSACDAGATVAGKWNIHTWLVRHDSRTGDQGPVVEGTSPVTHKDCGTLDFLDTESATFAGEKTLNRHLACTAAGPPPAPIDDVTAWSPGGTDPGAIAIFDGNDEVWNGPWTVSSQGDGVHLIRDFALDPVNNIVDISHNDLTLVR